MGLEEEEKGSEESVKGLGVGFWDEASAKPGMDAFLGLLGGAGGGEGEGLLFTTSQDSEEGDFFKAVCDMVALAIILLSRFFILRNSSRSVWIEEPDVF